MIISMAICVYAYRTTILSIDEPKLVQLIFERILLLAPSSQQWSGEFIVNLFSLPLNSIAVLHPLTFSHIVTIWLDQTYSSIAAFRIAYYSLTAAVILFFDSKEGLWSALIGTVLMEYFKVIPEFRLDVLMFYVLLLSIEKKNIVLFALATGIKSLSIIFLPLVVLLIDQNTVKKNIRVFILYFFLFNCSIILFPVLTVKAFLGDIFIKLFSKSTADFRLFSYGLYPLLFFLILLFLYRKEIFSKKQYANINKKQVSLLLVLFYCLVFIKLTGYLRFIFLPMPFVLTFIIPKIKLNNVVYYSPFLLLYANLFLTKPEPYPSKFKERNMLQFIYDHPNPRVDKFKNTFKGIPTENFYYQQILEEEKKNAKIFLDNY